jgi:hypothetical protein
VLRFLPGYFPRGRAEGCGPCKSGADWRAPCSAVLGLPVFIRAWNETRIKHLFRVLVFVCDCIFQNGVFTEPPGAAPVFHLYETEDEIAISCRNVNEVAALQTEAGVVRGTFVVGKQVYVGIYGNEKYASAGMSFHLKLKFSTLKNERYGARGVSRLQW